MQGMTVRLATYHNGGFKEGVSLTLYDELTRWEKYAYGCNELVFNPLSVNLNRSKSLWLRSLMLETAINGRTKVQ